MDAEVLAYLDAAYEPLRLLRRTDRGEVWLAVGRDGRPVIRKRIALSGLPYAQLMELQCPLCPQILYCAEEDGETVLVEEHIPGEPLSERLARGSHLDEEEARDILLQVAEGLLPIHEAGIVHRDIKPAHLLREKSGRIRLIDFDASRLVKEGKAEDTSRLGTKGYASPEQFGYGQTDARSDIYSLGVTVKELLGPGYRGWLSPVLDKCTQIDMDRRYASLSELREALLHPWRRRLKRTALAALLVFLAAIALYGTWHHGREGAVEPGMPAAPGAEEVPETPSEERREEPPAAGKDSAAPGMQSPPSPGTQETKAPAAPAQPSARKDPGSASHAEPAASSPAEGIPLREDAAPAEAPNHIRAQIFVNGEYSNAWMENWDTDITNAGSTLEIPRKLWEAWRDAPGGPLQLPEDWNARIHIANHTDQPWENPWVQLRYTSQGREETSVLQGRTLAPGESMDFDIPLGNYRIDHPEQGTNTTGGELAIQIHGDGPQELYCSRYSIGFMCREE